MTEATELAYDSGQPFLPAVEAAVKQTQTDSDFVEFFDDGSYRDRFQFIEHASTDGGGTKLGWQWRHRRFSEAAQDAFAMAINDLYRDRAVPYLLSNEIIVESQDDEAIIATVEGLASLAQARGIGIPSGETAIHYRKIHGMAISITATGAKAELSPNRYRPDDVLIGLPSSGVHANGISEVEKLFLNGPSPEYLAPTRIYDEISDLLFEVDVHGLTHITGDAFRKLKVNGPDLMFIIEHLPRHDTGALFDDLFDRWQHKEGDPGLADRLIHQTLNNGTGFVIGVHPGEVSRALDHLPGAEALGIVKRSDDPGVSVRSRYTGQVLQL